MISLINDFITTKYWRSYSQGNLLGNASLGVFSLSQTEEEGKNLYTQIILNDAHLFRIGAQQNKDGEDTLQAHSVNCRSAQFPTSAHSEREKKIRRRFDRSRRI